jgi:hypothetical protein
VQIDPYKDGVFAIRTHTDLRLNPSPKHGVHKVFGHAINSGGDQAKAVWGKRADWVHYFGTVEDKPAGIAFLSHPSNPSKGNEKAWWHARDYGLISANPFAPEKIQGDGGRTIPKGQSLGFRYQIIFHSYDNHEAAKIEERFAQYAKTPALPTSIMPKHPGYPEDYLTSRK